MATETRPYTDIRPEWHDPFPEPRTCPSGWDLSDLPRYERSSNSGKAFIVAAALDALAAESKERKPDPFPKVTTFPSGWDLTDVLALERERMKEKNSGQEHASFMLPISLNAVTCETI